MFELAAGEKMDVIVYCKAKSGAKFSILDADKVKGPFVENIDVTYKGSSDTDNSPPVVVSLTSGLVKYSCISLLNSLIVGCCEDGCLSIQQLLMPPSSPL